MSLGDELRIQRALAGGPTPLEIEEATGIAASLYAQLEQRYREMGDDETVEKLADYYSCDAQALRNARSRSRKAFSRHLAQAVRSKQPVRLKLRTGEVMDGLVIWWDLGAVGLDAQDEGPVTIIQRHAVIDW
jgi:transcriptional regulator with XRE-family HTH domain